ncbi:hypothetical protein WN943_006664 [Citrus x changshan-huyou]
MVKKLGLDDFGLFDSDDGSSELRHATAAPDRVPKVANPATADRRQIRCRMVVDGRKQKVGGRKLKIKAYGATSSSQERGNEWLGEANVVPAVYGWC